VASELRSDDPGTEVTPDLDEVAIHLPKVAVVSDSLGIRHRHPKFRQAIAAAEVLQLVVEVYQPKAEAESDLLGTEDPTDVAADHHQLGAVAMHLPVVLRLGDWGMEAIPDPDKEAAV